MVQFTLADDDGAVSCKTVFLAQSAMRGSYYVMIAHADGEAAKRKGSVVSNLKMLLNDT